MALHRRILAAGDHNRAANEGHRFVGPPAAPTSFQPSPLVKPSRQLGYRGCQPSSRLAFVFEAPRTSVIMTVAASPAASRASHRRTRLGGLASNALANTGSHSRTGAGSSSTTL